MSEQGSADHAIRARITRYLEAHGLTGRGARIVPLTGDASDRRYFRILLSDGPSVVLAVHAGPIDFDALPFANVARLLEEMDLPAPAILGHSDADGIIAQQDLGDVTLQAHLGAASAAEHAALYREAVALVARLQQQGAAFRSRDYVPYTIAFDVEKLTWELNFFVRHFLEAYRGVQLSDDDRQTLAAEWSAIATELSGEPRVLCHRDYHSRNLMLRDGRLYLIDFQDARMGPNTYDLVSLLRDSYVDLTESEVDQLIAYFLELTQPSVPEASDFRRRFDLMALQRNLKALGTFGFQTTNRGNPVYIQYIPRTLRHARANLLAYPRFAPLREVLSRHVEELR
jgi:aminoglycoside/choline kinase family phosphotransferase